MSTTILSRHLAGPAGFASERTLLGKLWQALLERLPCHQRRERLDQLISQYRTLPYETFESDANQQAREVIEDIIQKTRGRPPSWIAIETVDRAMLTILSGEVLKRQVRSLRAEFQLATKLVAADEVLWEVYQNSHPAEIEKCGEAELKADSVGLQEQLHALYANRRLQFRARNSIALWSALLFVAATIFTLQIDKLFNLNTMLFDVLGVGMLGGLFSTLLRVQKFKLAGIREASSIAEAGNRLTVILAPAIGGGGAVVLFVLLLSGFMQGSFFPALPVISFTPEKDYLEELFNIHIPSSADAAKLYLLCFLAGFSERLVPDMMSRLSTIGSRQRG